MITGFPPPIVTSPMFDDGRLGMGLPADQLIGFGDPQSLFHSFQRKQSWNLPRSPDCPHTDGRPLKLREWECPGNPGFQYADYSLYLSSVASFFMITNMLSFS